VLITDVAHIEIALLKAEMLREKARQNLSRAGGDKKSKGSPLPLGPKPCFGVNLIEKTPLAGLNTASYTPWNNFLIYLVIYE